MKLPVVLALVGGVALGALGTAQFVSGQTEPPAESVFVAVTPCRLIDTRPEFQVGDRSTPLPADADVRFNAHDGKDGDSGCAIPSSATAVSANVTAVGPTAASFLTLFPTGAPERPPTSNLNYLPGAPPTPNAVTIPLAADGGFSAYNLAGTVDVIVDLNGYYRGSTGPANMRVDGVVADGSMELAEGQTATATTIQLDAPVAGTVVVHGSASASDLFAGGKIFCSITTGTTIVSPLMAWESAGPDGSIGQLSGSRSFDVGAGTHTYRLVCQSVTSENDQSAFVGDATLTYIFVPS